jgi:O-antigen ligase
MSVKVANEQIEKFLGLALAVTTIAISPLISMDPINPPKFFALVISASVLGSLVFLIKKTIDFKQITLVTIISGILLFLLLINLIATGGNLGQKFFGVSGRNTGVLTYISLIVLMYAATVVALNSRLFKINFFIMFTGFASLAYGLIQAIGIDPFDWNNPYSRVFGFLGNPNFHSSFIAMFGVVTFAHGISDGQSKKLRFVYFSTTLLCLLSVITTKSQQGLLVFGIGSVIPLIVFLKPRINRVQSFALTILGSSFGLLAILGMLQIGPLERLLYKESVTYRGDYWRAGWRMATENPLFGVGFDQYGDWYRRARDVEAVLRRGPEFTSNAAHNVLIDFAASAGFLFLAAYLLLVFVTLRAAVKIINSGQGRNPIVVAIIAMWLAYQAQSLISINQIGLAIWGWVLSGLIIGYSKNLGNTNPLNSSNSSKHSGRKVQIQKGGLDFQAVLIGSTFGLVGAILSGPIMINSITYMNALKSATQSRVVDAAYLKPEEVTRMGEVAILLTQNKLEKEALDLTRDIVKKFPDSFEGWRYISQLPDSTEEEKAIARKEMKRLDPNNPDLK